MQESRGRQILSIKFLVPIKLSTQNRLSFLRDRIHQKILQFDKLNSNYIYKFVEKTRIF